MYSNIISGGSYQPLRRGDVGNGVMNIYNRIELHFLHHEVQMKKKNKTVINFNLFY
jgi:hypothetical protein